MEQNEKVRGGTGGKHVKRVAGKHLYNSHQHRQLAMKAWEDALGGECRGAGEGKAG